MTSRKIILQMVEALLPRNMSESIALIERMGGDVRDILTRVAARHLVANNPSTEVARECVRRGYPLPPEAWDSYLLHLLQSGQPRVAWAAVAKFGVPLSRKAFDQLVSKLKDPETGEVRSDASQLILFTSAARCAGVPVQLRPSFSVGLGGFLVYQDALCETPSWEQLKPRIAEFVGEFISPRGSMRDVQDLVGALDPENPLHHRVAKECRARMREKWYYLSPLLKFLGLKQQLRQGVVNVLAFLCDSDLERQWLKDSGLSPLTPGRSRGLARAAGRLALRRAGFPQIERVLQKTGYRPSKDELLELFLRCDLPLGQRYELIKGNLGDRALIGYLVRKKARTQLISLIDHYRVQGLWWLEWKVREALHRSIPKRLLYRKGLHELRQGRLKKAQVFFTRAGKRPSTGECISLAQRVFVSNQRIGVRILRWRCGPIERR